MRTLCTLVRDPLADEILAPYAALLAPARHWAFKELYILEEPVEQVKRECISRFGITARQFNGIRFQLEQAVEAWREGLKYRIGDTSDRIKGLVKKISGLEKYIEKEHGAKSPRFFEIARWWLELHQKRRELARCRLILERLKAELAGKPQICFGGRTLLRKGEVEEWQAKRNSQILLVGSKDEKCGNQSCQWDGESLLIKLPPSLGGQRVRLEGVRFAYGEDVLANRAGKPLSWLLFKDDEGRWHAHVTIPETPALAEHYLRWGAIGVDVNEAHLAVVIADRNGNLLGTQTLDFPESGLTTGKAEDILWSSVHGLVQLAQEHRCGIVVEDLDFSKKKSYLKAFGKKHAKRLSSFAYAKFFECLAAACPRQGVELRKINPAYTSRVARMKYALGYRISAHHAAAFVIARRGMNFGERFVCMDSGALLPTASMVGRHVLSRWRSAHRLTSTEVGRLVSLLTAIGFMELFPWVRLSRRRRIRPDTEPTTSLAAASA
jgi:IS605 OrfB family transposase